jgi:hypothetical protein
MGYVPQPLQAQTGLQETTAAAGLRPLPEIKPAASGHHQTTMIVHLPDITHMLPTADHIGGNPLL